MTVAELIEKLGTYPQDLPVCLGDWQEQYAESSARQAEKISVETGEYWPGRSCGLVSGEYLQIGDGC